MKFQGNDGVYTTIKVLGTGFYGVVFRVRREYDGKEFALKVFTSIANGFRDRNLEREVGHLLKVNRECPPFITCIHDEGKVQITEELKNYFRREVREEYEGMTYIKEIYFLVQELMDGDVGELYENGDIEPTQIFDLMEQTLKGIHWLHEKGFAHNDIKPQNILYKRNGNALEFKLGDLGSACFRTDSGQIKQCNAYSTFYFAAPEILLRFYNPIRLQEAQVAEMWSLGVTYYLLLKKKEDPQLDFYDALPYKPVILEVIKEVIKDWNTRQEIRPILLQAIQKYFKDKFILYADFSFPEIPLEKMEVMNKVINELILSHAEERLTSKQALEILEVNEF